jgi:hypothetical protein
MSAKEEETERVRNLLVDLVLALRAQYLAGGASPLKHWSQITERMRAAAAVTSGPREWCTELMRKLGVVAPSRETCSAVDELVTAVELKGQGIGRRAFLALVDREWGYLIAEARARADERKAERAAKKAAAEEED